MEREKEFVVVINPDQAVAVQIAIEDKFYRISYLIMKKF